MGDGNALIGFAMEKRRDEEQWKGGSQMLRITEINGNDVSVPGMEEGEEE